MYARPYSRLRLWRDFAIFILESKNAFPSGGRGSFISPLFSDKCHQILSGIMVGGVLGAGHRNHSSICSQHIGSSLLCRFSGLRIKAL